MEIKKLLKNNITVGILIMFVDLWLGSYLITLTSHQDWYQFPLFATLIFIFIFGFIIAVKKLTYSL